LLAKLQLEAAAEAEALALADATLPLLKPAGKTASQCIVDVSVAGSIVRLELAERNEIFREIVKAARFSWASTAWERTTNSFTGTAIDRAADIARSLLERGFTVRVRDAAAHDKAISGEYEDEQTRWVKTISTGPHSGWLYVGWAYEDDMYEVARRLPGAIYNPKCSVVCPPDSVADVLDFASVHGFSVTPSARAVLDNREAELARGVVVAMRRRTKKAPAKIAPGVPKLAVVAGEIDDDLRDND
jgi:hypothetical protein